MLGAETHFLGKVGEDAYGAAALENLRDRGVIIDNVRTSKTAPTGVAFVAVGAEDETNSIVVVPGTNLCGNQAVSRVQSLGDDTAVLARSSDEERAPPRYQAGVASMAWRSTR